MTKEFRVLIKKGGIGFIAELMDYKMIQFESIVEGKTALKQLVLDGISIIYNCVLKPKGEVDFESLRLQTPLEPGSDDEIITVIWENKAEKM